ncbi:MAG: hypothetical protein K5745_04990 [Saccharofermentans sp.]|nr:hypothetical protein [Saccharofermentans sp.]
MRRDYFTCVFLALVAGALTFVCFKPLYFTFQGIVPRVFGVIEILLSLLYVVFFVFFLPVFGAYRKKTWVNFGLAAYGLLIYLPKWFYPAPEAITGDSANLVSSLVAMLLRGIYDMVQAPFAATSALAGDKVAGGLSYWILPLSLLWLLLFKVARFYRNAYLTEQLAPRSDQGEADPAIERKPKAEDLKNKPEPEVLGTVIQAPSSSVSPEEVAKEAARSRMEREQKKAQVRPPVRKVNIKTGSDEAIPLGAPKNSDVIELGPPKDEGDDGVIRLGPPK